MIATTTAKTATAMLPALGLRIGHLLRPLLPYLPVDQQRRSAKKTPRFWITPHMCIIAMLAHVMKTNMVGQGMANSYVHFQITVRAFCDTVCPRTIPGASCMVTVFSPRFR